MKRKALFKKFVATLLAVLFAVLSTGTAFAADEKSSETGTFYVEGEINNTYADEVLSKLNTLRAGLGVGELKMNSVLCDIAAQRAAEIAVNFSHERPDGRDCFTFYIPEWEAVGENIAIGHRTPDEVMKGWTESEGHYLNMIDDDYTEVGIACFKSSNNYLCWVQYFAKCPSFEVTKSGTETKRFKIIADAEHVNLVPSSENYHFSGSDSDARFSFDIYNVNKGFSYVRQQILPNTVLFSSSDDTVAESLESDIFRVRGYGEAIIYASLSALGTVSATVSVQKSGASDTDLMFVLNDNGDGYILSDCKETVEGRVTVPSFYNGLPVTGVGDMAFYNCTSLTGLTLPESVKSIGRFAFYNCPALLSLKVPDNVTFVGMNAFGYVEENGILSVNENAVIFCKSGSVAEEYAKACGINYVLTDDILYGDVNGDGVLSPSDVVLLRRYFANYSSESETSTITVFPGADVNGDGELSPSDVVLLRRYFANYNSETGESTIVLGKA